MRFRARGRACAHRAAPARLRLIIMAEARARGKRRRRPSSSFSTRSAIFEKPQRDGRNAPLPRAPADNQKAGGVGAEFFRVVNSRHSLDRIPFSSTSLPHVVRIFFGRLGHHGPDRRRHRLRRLAGARRLSASRADGFQVAFAGERGSSINSFNARVRARVVGVAPDRKRRIPVRGPARRAGRATDRSAP